MKQIFLNGKPVVLCTEYDIKEGWVRCMLPDPAPPSAEQIIAMKILPDLIRVKVGSNGRPIDIFRYGKVEVKDV